MRQNGRNHGARSISGGHSANRQPGGSYGTRRYREYHHHGDRDAGSHQRNIEEVRAAHGHAQQKTQITEDMKNIREAMNIMMTRVVYWSG
eukprot:16030677-Heterocapsa_arctica.AAC.1